jgi:nitrate reductase cytochrome c-type subunit
MRRRAMTNTPEMERACNDTELRLEVQELFNNFTNPRTNITEVAEWMLHKVKAEKEKALREFAEEVKKMAQETDVANMRGYVEGPPVMLVSVEEVDACLAKALGGGE